MINVKKINWPVAAIILFAAVVRFPVGSELRAGFDFNIRVGIIFIFALWLVFEINIWAGLFLMLSLFSSVIPWFVITKYKDLQTIGSYLALDAVVLSLILYMIVSTVDEKPIYLVLGLIAMANILFLVCQGIGIDPYQAFGMKGNCSPTGLMANKNEVSTTIALCSPVFFREKAWLLIPFLIVGLYISDSLGGALGFLSVVFVFMIVNLTGYKRWFVLSVYTFGIIAVTYFDLSRAWTSAVGSRLYIWEKALILAKHNQPCLGFGIGNWKAIDSHLIAKGAYDSIVSWSRVHNSFIQAYVELGIGFIIICAGYLIDVFRNLKYSIPALAILPIIICCSTNSLFQMNAINGMIVVIWLALLNKNRKSEWKNKIKT